MTVVSNTTPLIGLHQSKSRQSLLEEIKPYLFRLRERGFSISQYVIDVVLEQAGEK